MNKYSGNRAKRPMILFDSDMPQAHKQTCTVVGLGVLWHLNMDTGVYMFEQQEEYVR